MIVIMAAEALEETKRHAKIYKNQYFCEDNKHASSFMVDLAVGHYHEHSTMAGRSICKA